MTPDQIQLMLSPTAYPHPVNNIELIETHISWVLLTGPYAYKVKKPLDLGFLDFSDLAKREFYCHEELRLNRRTASSIYRAVVPIILEGQLPLVSEEEDGRHPIEYAVQMKQFDNSELLANLVSQDNLPIELWERLADVVADFHAEAEIYRDEDFGEPEMVVSAVEQNFLQIRPYLTNVNDIHWLAHIEDWSQEYSRCLETMMHKRKQNGFVRDCHGDLHLGNIVRIKDEIIPFDCIEFNKSFRIIDTASEIAFTVMDLEVRGLWREATRFLNRYLESSGDYRLVELLNYYKVYRAMVRAKVSLLATSIQDRATLESTKSYQDFQRYLKLAIGYLKVRPACIAIMHGVSGSGKSFQAQQLAESLGAIRIRSDVERKRIYGLAANEKSESGLDRGIYSADASEKTFCRLAELAQQVVDAGLPCIIDATFLHRSRREQFLNLAEQCDVPFLIIDCQPPEHIILERLKTRQQQDSDASEADEKVMRQQVEKQELFSKEERPYVFTTDTLATIDVDAISRHLALEDVAYSSYNDCGSQA